MSASPESVITPESPCPPVSETSKLTKPLSPSFDATWTPLPPFEYATTGPPGAVTTAGYADQVLPLTEIAGALLQALPRPVTAPTAPPAQRMSPSEALAALRADGVRATMTGDRR